MVKPGDVVCDILWKIVSDKGIMARNDQIRMACKSFERVKSIEHVLHIHHDREGFARAQVFPKVCRI